MKIPDNVSDNERARLKALTVNEERRLAGLDSTHYIGVIFMQK